MKLDSKQFNTNLYIDQSMLLEKSSAFNHNILIKHFLKTKTAYFQTTITYRLKNLIYSKYPCDLINKRCQNIVPNFLMYLSTKQNINKK